MNSNITASCVPTTMFIVLAVKFMPHHMLVTIACVALTGACKKEGNRNGVWPIIQYCEAKLLKLRKVDSTPLIDAEPTLTWHNGTLLNYNAWRQSLLCRSLS